MMNFFNTVSLSLFSLLLLVLEASTMLAVGVGGTTIYPLSSKSEMEAEGWEFNLNQSGGTNAGVGKWCNIDNCLEFLV